eukprot:337333-Prorocentrum_minimum.AAC.2
MPAVTEENVPLGARRLWGRRLPRLVVRFVEGIQGLVGGLVAERASPLVVAVLGLEQRNRAVR